MHLTVFLSQLIRRRPRSTGGFLCVRLFGEGTFSGITQHPARSAHTRCIRPASAFSTSINSKTTTIKPSGIDTLGRTQRSAPTRRICSMKGQPNMGHRKSHIETNQRDAGWNVERVCREPDISAGGGCKPAIIRRLSGRAPSTMVISSKSLPNNPSWPSGMVDPHGSIARRASQAEPRTKRDFHPIRRDRHTRDASTRQAEE